MGIFAELNDEEIKQKESLEIKPDKEIKEKRTPRTYGTDDTLQTIESYQPVNIVTTTSLGKLRQEEDEKKATKRYRVRQPFEYYQDQLDDIKMLKKKIGQKLNIDISQSKLVRDMIDEGISKRKKELGLI